MRVSDFDFDLPDELIAQRPAARRRDSRLLHLPAGGVPQDRKITDLPELLREGDLLVMNDVRVYPARLRGHKAGSGGAVEVLVERITGKYRALAQIRASKSPKPGTRLVFADGALEVEVTGRQSSFFELDFPTDREVFDWLAAYGTIPLPPYIDREADASDSERYQTVFAGQAGAVAAPTAGLHFDEPLLDELARCGIGRTTIRLNVGAGTFQPMRVEDTDDHQMHSEWIEVGQDSCAKIAETRAHGGRVVAIGTTVVRALESAAASGRLEPFSGDTRLFITPGYRFRSVDLLLTNFHLPRSTLLMLVCAFAGQESLLSAYRHAVSQQYRFFSYGDAMLLEPIKSVDVG